MGDFARFQTDLPGTSVAMSSGMVRKVAWVSMFLVACVGDDSVTPGQDSGGTDSGAIETGADASGSDASVNDVAVDAPPPPCGAAGESCCKAPIAPCGDGLTCSTDTTPKCMVNDVYALGIYQTVTPGPNLITTYPVAHYDGVAWTLMPPAKSVSSGFTPYDPIELLDVGTAPYVLSNENDVGFEYRWNGVSWQQCKLGNSCVGPTMNTYVWGMTAVSNSGATDIWLAGTNTMFRCANGASSCVSVTNGINGTWGEGTFGGTTSQDIWYSQYDHVLHYDGTQWSSMAVADAFSIAVLAPNDAWVGAKQFRHWDGKTWSSAYLASGQQLPANITHMQGSGSNDVHAVGRDNTNASFAAHWDGTAWKSTTLPSGMLNARRVYAPSPIEAFTVGGKGSNKGVIAKWNGTAWGEMPSPTVTYSGEMQAGTLTWVAVSGQVPPR